MIIASLFFAMGIACLVLGAEIMVRGAAKLSIILGISPLVIGLTVVAFGTSSPELAVCLEALAIGSSSVALGNVVGSNICNVFLVLGAASLFAPLAVSTPLIRRDVPTMIAVSFLPFLLGLDGVIGRVDGIFLVSLYIAHTYWLIWLSRRTAAREAQRSVQENDTSESPRHKWGRSSCMVVAGLAMLFLGARWVVGGAVTFAGFFGVSDLVIGLTVVAVSTSLPEIVTAVVAGLRGHTDIAVGNVVGSNMLNILLVLGLACAVSPRALPVDPHAMRVDIPIMIAAAVVCLPIFFTRGTIDRWEGSLFLLYYIIYAAYLVLNASDQALAPMYGFFVLGVVIPLTLIPLVISFRKSVKA